MEISILNSLTNDYSWQLLNVHLQTYIHTWRTSIEQSIDEGNRGDV